MILKVVKKKRLHLLLNLIAIHFGSWKLNWVHCLAGCVASRYWRWCLVLWSNEGKTATLRTPERGWCWAWWNMPMMELRLSEGLNVGRLKLLKGCYGIAMKEVPLMMMVVVVMPSPWL